MREATDRGWTVHYIPDRILKAWGAKIRAGVVEMADPGFPDLVLARPDDTLFFAELKAEDGTIKDAQMAWRDMLLGLGFEWHCWRPRHLDDVILPRLDGIPIPSAAEGMEGELWPEPLLTSISSPPGGRKLSSRHAMPIFSDTDIVRLLDGRKRKTDQPTPPTPSTGEPPTP